MANLYAKAAGGNWNNAATWSATSSAGVDNAGVPTASDDIIFDSGAVGTVTVNHATQCLGKSTTFNSANNRVAFTAGMSLLLSGAWNTSNFDMTGIVSGTGTLNLRTAGTHYIGTFPGALTFGVAATHVMGNDWTITGVVTVATATVLNNNGTAKTLTCNGGITMTSTLQGTALVNLNGGIWAGTGSLYNTTSISGTGSSAAVATSYRGGTLSSVAGCNWTTTGSTLVLAAACTLNTPHITWNNVTNNASANFTSSGTLNVNGIYLTNSVNPGILGGQTLNIAKFKHIATTSNSTLTFTSGTVLNISTSFEVISTANYTATLQALTPSSPITINYSGTQADCNCVKAAFLDVNLNVPITNWNGGALTRTTNITNRAVGNIDGNRRGIKQ